MNKIKNSHSILYAWLLLFSLNCKNDNSKHEKGFVVFIDPAHWYYVPATRLNDEEYLDQFSSDNLGYGIQFRPFFKGKNDVLNNLDTIPIDNFNTDLAPDLSTLKIVPVEIEYEVARERIPSFSIFKFSCKVRGKEVNFKFSTLQMKINDIRSIHDRR